MDELQIKKLKDFYGALNNVKRLKMILYCSKEGLTVTELSKKLKLNYNITSEYVNLLAKEGLVGRIRNPDRTVTVKSLVKIYENGEIEIIQS
jgi:DNA-binding MarR family transcriptional regulator